MRLPMPAWQAWLTAIGRLDVLAARRRSREGGVARRAPAWSDARRSPLER